MAGSEGHPEQTKRRSLTTPDPFGNSTTNTAYNKLLLLQQSIMPLISYQYNNPPRSYTPTETASYYVIIPLLTQQASL